MLKRTLLLLLAVCAAIYLSTGWLSDYVPVFSDVISGGGAQKKTQSGQITQKRVTKLPVTEEAVGEKTLDDVIREFIENSNMLNKEFTINIGGIPEEELTDLFLELGICSSLSWLSESNESGKILTLKPVYTIFQEISYAHKTGDTSVLSGKSAEVYNEAKRVIAEYITDSMSDYEKELIMHDYLVLNAQYDVEAEKNQSNHAYQDSFSAYGIFMKKKAVCQGYTEAMNILMLMLSIECAAVSGEAGGTPHTWNIIKLDEEYYHVDITWDDPVPDDENTALHTYFNLSDEMILKDHKISGNAMKCQSDKYNYFVYNNLQAKSNDDVAEIINDALIKGETTVEMKLSGFDSEGINFDYISKKTGVNSFKYSEIESQNVINFYLGR